MSILRRIKKLLGIRPKYTVRWVSPHEIALRYLHMR